MSEKTIEIGGPDYRCPVQLARDYLAGVATTSVPAFSYPRGGVSVRLNEVLPPYVAKALHTGLPMMDRAWRGRFLRDAVLVGPESRGSSPVRIVRDDLTRESPVGGLYPVGEGAGYAGGIVVTRLSMDCARRVRSSGDSRSNKARGRPSLRILNCVATLVSIGCYVIRSSWNLHHETLPIHPPCRDCPSWGRRPFAASQEGYAGRFAAPDHERGSHSG